MNDFNKISTRENTKYDTKNLRIEADYEIQVGDDVYWVPVNQLGKSKYSNDEIMKLLPLSPEEKMSKVSTLYEAIQLYQASKFKGIIDNYKVVQDNRCWNYHKSGYHSVRTNEGCCASNSNWLNYLLNDKYEEVGFIHYSQSNGGGHVMNYIHDNGWYYFIDMMMYRIDSLPFAGTESGTVDGFKDNELIAGNFLKSKNPVSYINYCLKKHNDPPVFFTLAKEREVYAMAADGVPNCFDIIHPIGMDIVLLFKNKDFNINLRFEDAPECNPDWVNIPSYQFSDLY